METNVIDGNKKRSKTIYVCNDCDFTTDKKYNYNTHMKSLRHKKNTTEPEQKQYVCKLCNKQYVGHSGLWKHSKTCFVVTKDDPILVNEVEKLKDQVQNLTEIIKNMMKNDKITNSQNNNSNNTNSNNSSIINNVIIMLNEKCGNAANIKDVIAAYTQKIGMEELKKIEHSNYVDGASAMATEALNVTNPMERSLYHVPDEKLSYVRDEGTWKCETKENMPIIEGTIDVLCDNIDKKATKQYAKRTPIEQKRMSRKFEHKKKNEPAVKKAIVENVLQKAVCEDDTLRLE